MMSSHETIGKLEIHLAKGDLAGASSALLDIHNSWNTLDAAAQRNIKTLEAIYPSLAQKVVEAKTPQIN